MSADKRLEVRAIENGTVIDHIPADSLFKIIGILGLERETHRITFGMNLESGRMGKKAIIKINDRYCVSEEMNRIALVAPMAKVNIIKNFEVVEKHEVKVPGRIGGFVKCVNPKCVTNNESMTTDFDVIEGERIALRCRYCEKTTWQGQMELIK
jgi:aspartate carbamoyltransferase regulatory subunit